MKIPEVFTKPIDEACIRYGIAGKRKAAFLANCAVESASFTKLQENLFYTTPERILKVFPSRVKTLAEAKRLTRRPQALANVVYSNRLGNGSVASGDGWRYAGKGLFQLTGKENYELAEKALGRPYVAHPELLLQPEDAALTAAWYWQKSGCNEAIDRGDFSSVVRRINGPAKLHEAERLAIYNDILYHVA